MDHFLVPRDPIIGRLEVQLLCDPDHSDGYTFREYPSKVDEGRWQRAVPADDEPFWLTEQHDSCSTEELQAFIQSWLFFCLLRDMLGRHKLFDVTDYLRGSGEHRHVRSDRLVDRLQQWHDAVKPQVHQQSSILDEVISNLQLFREALVAVKRRPDFHHGLCQSLTSLLELLSRLVHELRPSQVGTHFTLPLEWNEADRTSMQQHGWCPFEIDVIDRTYNSVATRYFFRNLRKPSKTGEHDHCSAQECLTHRRYLENWLPKHVNDNCKCQMVGPDLHAVKGHLDAGSYPLLRIKGSNIDEVSFEVVAWQPERSYVALSHVWVDGLGNPESNLLPRCQALRLRHLVKNFRGKQFSRWTDQKQETLERYIEGRDLLVWCDTLCCPVDEYRSIALGKMWEVYFHASYVLVLENSLLKYDYESIKCLETQMRIASSKWYFRGWTLQEAGLGDSLVFQFRDGIVEHRRIWEEIQEVHSSKYTLRDICLEVNTSCLALRVWFIRRHPSWSTFGISSVISNFQNRRLSVPDDEPLCLAALFDLDLGSVISAPKHMRMQRIWELQSQTARGISCSMAFNEIARLENPGFRWAPKSFLGTPSSLSLSMGNNDDFKATATESGLLIRAKSWKLQHSGSPGGIPDDLWQLSNVSPMNRIIHLRDGEGIWYTINPAKGAYDEYEELHLKATVADVSREWYVLFDPNIRDHAVKHRVQMQRALLGYLERYEDATPVLRSVRVIHVLRLHNYADRLFRLAYQPAMDMRQEAVGPGTEVLSAMSRDMLSHKLLAASKKACEVQEVLDACMARKPPDQSVEMFFATFMITPFMGRHAQVTEASSAAQEWFVD